MAYSKYALYRYNILDNIFRKKDYTFDQILEALNTALRDRYEGSEEIKTRTLRNDIKKFREEFNAPLPENQRTYKYSDPNFTIADQPLTEEDRFYLDRAYDLLDRFENHPKYDRIAESLLKLEEENKTSNQKKVLYYDWNEEHIGREHLKPIYKAIENKCVLEVKYKGYRDEKSTTYIFHPHVLKQYNSRWFVFGLNPSHPSKKWSIPLDDRLIAREPLEDIEYIENQIDWGNHFSRLVGVRSFNQEPEMVELRFYNNRKEYFMSKPFVVGPDEYFEDDKSDLVFFECIVNQELIQQILSYGSDVEVLKPKSLRDKIVQHLNDLKGYYSKE